MKPNKKNRLKRRRRHEEREARNPDSTDEDIKSPPTRVFRKRKRKEADISEDIIDGFSIQSFKTYEMLIESKKNEIKYSIEDIVDKQESPETSSLNPVEESCVSSGSTGCGGYLGESENSELDEAKKLSSKTPKKINLKSKNEDESFFCVVKTDDRIKETLKEAESEPTDDDVILCPTPEPVVKKKTPVSKPHVTVKMKQQQPQSTTAPQNSSKIINNYENKELKRSRQHVKVPPTMTVQPEQRRSNLVLPMMPVVKPTSSLVGPPPQPSFGPLRRNPQQFQPPLYPTLPPPTIPSHPGLLDQNYLQAELNSRFLQESQAERQRNGFHHPHHPHQHQFSHHSFNRVLPIQAPSNYSQSHYYNSTNYGAFHPKIHPTFPTHVVSQSSFHPQTHNILNVPQITKEPALSAPCKKHTKAGKWCALHVKIALMIQNHQKKQDKGEIIRSQKNKISSFYTPQQLTSTEGYRPETLSSALSWRPRHLPIFPSSVDSQNSNFHHRHNQMIQPMSSKQDQPSTGLFHHPHHLANTSRRSNPQPMTELSRAPVHLLPTRYDFYPSSNGNAVATPSGILPPTIPSPFSSPLLPNPATSPFYQHPYYLYGPGTMNSSSGFNNQPTTAPHHQFGRPRLN